MESDEPALASDVGIGDDVGEAVSDQEQEDAEMFGFQNRESREVVRQIGRGRANDPRRGSKVPTLEVSYDVFMDVWRIARGIAEEQGALTALEIVQHFGDDVFAQIKAAMSPQDAWDEPGGCSTEAVEADVADLVTNMLRRKHKAETARERQRDLRRRAKAKPRASTVPARLRREGPGARKAMVDDTRGKEVDLDEANMTAKGKELLSEAKKDVQPGDCNNSYKMRFRRRIGEVAYHRRMRCEPNAVFRTVKDYWMGTPESWPSGSEYQHFSAKVCSEWKESRKVYDRRRNVVNRAVVAFNKNICGDMDMSQWRAWYLSQPDKPSTVEELVKSFENPHCEAVPKQVEEEDTFDQPLPDDDNLPPGTRNYCPRRKKASSKSKLLTPAQKLQKAAERAQAMQEARTQRETIIRVDHIHDSVNLLENFRPFADSIPKKLEFDRRFARAIAPLITDPRLRRKVEAYNTSVLKTAKLKLTVDPHMDDDACDGEDYKIPARTPKAKQAKKCRGRPRAAKKRPAESEPPKQPASFSDGEDHLGPRKRRRVVQAKNPSHEDIYEFIASAYHDEAGPNTVGELRALTATRFGLPLDSFKGEPNRSVWKNAHKAYKEDHPDSG